MRLPLDRKGANVLGVPACVLAVKEKILGMQKEKIIIILQY